MRPRLGDLRVEEDDGWWTGRRNRARSARARAGRKTRWGKGVADVGRRRHRYGGHGDGQTGRWKRERRERGFEDGRDELDVRSWAFQNRRPYRARHTGRVRGSPHRATPTRRRHPHPSRSQLTHARTITTWPLCTHQTFRLRFKTLRYNTAPRSHAQRSLGRHTQQQHSGQQRTAPVTPPLAARIASPVSRA